MANLIWTSTTFHDRTSYLACNGTRGVYELRPTGTPGGDFSVTVYLNDKLIGGPFIGYQDAADLAAGNEAGWFDDDHFDGSRLGEDR
jgi:hypothetical protein